jgi:hypothetical protein
MRKPISLWIRLALLLLLAAVAVMSFVWMPTAVDYASDFLGGASRPVLYALCGGIALVMATVVILAFRLPWAIDADCIFHARTARLLRGIGALLGGDCLFFGALAIALLTAGDILLAPVLLFVDGIGFCLTLMLFVLSDYVGRAAILKEEADGTL